jgi:acyl-CoA thioesterase
MDKITLLQEKFAREGYAHFLGMELEELQEGYARVRMRVEPRFHNIFSTLHGGALFSLLDEAFELACNSHVEDAVAMSVTVHYIKPLLEGWVKAEAKEIALTARTGIYDIEARDEEGNLVALARAICYRKRKD